MMNNASRSVVIQHGDFYIEVKDEETNLMKERSYELLKNIEKKQLGKNEEAKITIYNALPRKDIDLLTKEYKKFSISNKETIGNGFTRFNDIVTSLKSLDLDYSSKNRVRKFFRDLLLKWRAKVKAIEKSKDLATLPLNGLIGDLKAYEMVLDSDGVASKTTKEKVKSLALKAKVTREQTSDDNDIVKEIVMET
nr:UBN2 domain-containing protein [Tanacetum cinerariifolium]